MRVSVLNGPVLMLRAQLRRNLGQRIQTNTAHLIASSRRKHTFFISCPSLFPPSHGPVADQARLYVHTHVMSYHFAVLLAPSGRLVSCFLLPRLQPSRILRLVCYELEGYINSRPISGEWCTGSSPRDSVTKPRLYLQYIPSSGVKVCHGGQNFCFYAS